MGRDDKAERSRVNLLAGLACHQIYLSQVVRWLLAKVTPPHQFYRLTGVGMGDVIDFDKRQKIVVPWAENKEDFLLSVNYAEWIITEDNELYYTTDDDQNLKIKDNFLIVERAAYHTTDWVRLYFQEHHPEIDFDKKFKTDEPGVFARIHEEFEMERNDIDEWCQNKIYERLENELAKLGYKIEWT